MKPPEGFEPAGNVEVQCDFGDIPEGFEKAPHVKMPRAPRGKLHLCQNCYKTGIGYVDTVCPACLNTLKHLAILRQEIGRVQPKALDMSLPVLFRSLWQAYRKLKKAA